MEKGNALVVRLFNQSLGTLSSQYVIDLSGDDRTLSRSFQSTFLLICLRKAPYAASTVLFLDAYILTDRWRS